MIAGKNILGLIPARGGSKRVPAKNLQKLGDKSLLEITIEQAQSSVLIDKVVVSSDDQAILHVAKSVGVCALARPESLSRDDTPGIAPVIHALQVFNRFDYIVLLQVTSPFRLVADIDNAIRLCVEKPAPACVSVCRPQHHPAWMFKINRQGKLQPLHDGDIPARSQDLPPCYSINGAIYVAERELPGEKKSFIVADTLAYEMPADRSLDIDTEYDLRLARAMWKV